MTDDQGMTVDGSEGGKPDREKDLRHSLLSRLEQQPIEIGAPWSREELYD